VSGARSPRSNLSHVVPSTQNFISNFCTWCHVTNNYLFAFDNHDATNGSSVMSCPRTTPAQSFNLQGVDSIG
jgi:hypothetical protein